MSSESGNISNRGRRLGWIMTGAAAVLMLSACGGNEDASSSESTAASTIETTNESCAGHAYNYSSIEGDIDCDRTKSLVQDVLDEGTASDSGVIRGDELECQQGDEGWECHGTHDDSISLIAVPKDDSTDPLQDKMQG